MRRIIFVLLVLFYSSASYSQIKRSEKPVTISGKKYYLHKVESKQTLYSISKAYSVSINTILKANHKQTVDLREGELLKIPYTAPATVVQNLRYRYYIVKKNDTLFSLAKRFHTTQEELITLNAGIEVALIEGRRLIVPLVNEDQPRYDANYYYHIVSKKETFSAIARHYGINLRKLKKTNKNLDPDRISPKDEIKIPIENARAEVARIRLINRKTKGEKEVLIVDNLSEKKKGTFIQIPEGWNPTTSYEEQEDGYETESSLFYEGNFRDSYKMLVFLPLQNSYSGMLDYYKGMRLAMQENSDVPVLIKVYDSYKDGNVVRNYLQKEEDVDFIVGPYLKQVFPTALDFADENTAVVSLLSKNNEVYKNENIFQINTTERSINYKIAQYVLTEHPADNIIFFNGTTFKKYVTPDSLKIKPLADMINNYQSNRILDNIESYREEFEKLFDEEKKNIIIIPESDQIRVSTLLSALNIFSMHDIEVIGYYKWKLLPNIEPEILFNLNVTYFTPFHYLPTEQKVFVEMYKEQFGSYPNDFSYMGYKTMQTLLRGIRLGGKDFYKKPLQQIQKHKGGGYENINLHKVQFTDDFKIISD